VRNHNTSPELAKSNDSKFQYNHAKPIQTTDTGFAGLASKSKPTIADKKQKNDAKTKKRLNEAL
jgi:hypothetical protein